MNASGSLWGLEYGWVRSGPTSQRLMTFLGGLS